MPQDHIRDRSGHSRTVRATLMRSALGAALAALVVCANTAAARAGDNDDESFATKFMRTLGLKNPGTMEYGINYSERSPLVVPPTRDLPPPATAAAVPTPNWPKDPDIKRRAEAKAKEKVVPQIDRVVESSRVLRPDELNPPGANTAPTPAAGGSSAQAQANPPPPPKKSIFSFDWFKKKEEYATFTGEPSRTSLTDPPSGYMTPSPDQPYGIGPEKKAYHVPTASEHGELQR